MRITALGEDGRERFPARQRLLSAPLSPCTATASEPDPLLDAARRLLQPSPREASPASVTEDPARQPFARASQDLALDLGSLSHRLLGLLHLLEEDPAKGDRIEVEARPQDSLAQEALSRASAYFDEWRSLILEPSPPECVLADFTASSYMDLLDRLYPLLMLVLGPQGELLRVAGLAFAPEALKAHLGIPATSLRLSTPDASGHVRLHVPPHDAWRFLHLPLEEGHLLILPRDGSAKAAKPLQQRRD